jgi:flagellar protein FlgJ
VRISPTRDATQPRVTHEVEPHRTPATRSELRAAIARALETAQGRRPSGALVDTLTAQACLETASGSRMYDYNFGGIKGAGPRGAAVLTTSEVVGGKQITIRDRFRAYATLDEGALDYVRLIEGRFKGALAPAERGDVIGFARELKRAGYYTASEEDYARGLARLMSSGEGARELAGRSAHGGGAAAPLTAAGLARVQDSLDASCFAGAHGPCTRREESDEDDSS